MTRKENMRGIRKILTPKTSPSFPKNRYALTRIKRKQPGEDERQGVEGVEEDC